MTKIVGHTLTICADVILTTNMRVQTLFESGWNTHVLAKLESYGCKGLELSAINRNPLEAKMAAVAAIKNSLEKLITKPKFWMLSGHAAAQLDSPLTRYRKFIKGHAIHLTAHSSLDAIEWDATGADGLRYFVAIDCRFISEEAIFHLFETEKTTLLLAADESYTASDMVSELASGWDSEDLPIPSNFFRIIDSHDAILIKDFGVTEQGEAGAIVIGKTDLMEQLENELKNDAGSS